MVAQRDGTSVTSGESPVQRAAGEFVAEFARWRSERGMSKKQLAAAMGFDPSYLSHVEAHRHRPTADFARRAEAVLQAGGAIWRRFREYDDLRTNARIRMLPGQPVREPPITEPWLATGGGLIVDRETARLSYVDGRYRCTVRRALYNAGPEPVTRYLIRVAVDRFPEESVRSNEHHHTHPLTWDELSLLATCGGERMDWRPKSDRDAIKEAWLLFENAQGRFPLYPGQRATIQYTYHVGADKWGPWFLRSIRLPTRRLRIELDLPMSLRPVVWGVETTFSTEAMPLRTPIEQEIDGDRAVFGWATDNPPLHARYRLEWRFRSATPTPRSSAHDDDPAPDPAESREPLSARMSSVGILQRGAEVLQQPTRWLDLPRETALAVETADRLTRVLSEVSRMHVFRKGIGLAAPQLGLPVAVAVIQPTDSRERVLLINPRVLEESREYDEQFEGCLSFFDQRGMVARPLRLVVEYGTATGQRIQTAFAQGLARLVAHEIDHLNGRLYVDRMPAGAPLVPFAEYDQTGQPWQYK
jgi:peptide deformylase